MADADGASRGRFIVFEGIDGSGKSTAIQAVAERLRGEGHAVWTTREETETWRGDAVRRSIEEGASPLATAFHFLADRAQHVPEIEARLAAGEVVLCDRFLHSTLAYQGVTLGAFLPDPTTWLESLHADWCPRPDAVILFDIDPAVSLARIGDRDETSRYEKAEFLQRVRIDYLDLAAADPATISVVEADRAPEDVLSDVMGCVQAALR